MRTTYNSHAQMFACAFSTLQDQPAALATNNPAPANLEIDAVISPPLDNARNDRRAEREQAAALSGGPGDDDDDDGDDDGNNNNNPDDNDHGNSNGRGIIIINIIYEWWLGALRIVPRIFENVFMY